MSAWIFIGLVIGGVWFFCCVMVIIGAFFVGAKVPPTSLRRVRLKWEPRDLWLGCYWTADPVVRIYLCLVPCCVLIFEEHETPSRGVVLEPGACMFCRLEAI